MTQERKTLISTGSAPVLPKNSIRRLYNLICHTSVQAVEAVGRPARRRFFQAFESERFMAFKLMMHSKRFSKIGLALFAGVLLWSCPASSEAASDHPPSIVFILVDDQGYYDLGCYGATEVKTPRIDAMAQEGTRFTDYYAAAPICSPSRAGLLTGCYPRRVGNEMLGPSRGFAIGHSSWTN